jgi:hypothetical protein
MVPQNAYNEFAAALLAVDPQAGNELVGMTLQIRKLGKIRKLAASVFFECVSSGPHVFRQRLSFVMCSRGIVINVLLLTYVDCDSFIRFPLRIC